MLRRAGTAVFDGLCDRWLGIESASVESAPTPYRILFKLVAALDLMPSDRFVDFGCGKGRMLCVAARCRVRRVIGVELRPDSALAALANLKGLRGRKAMDCAVFTGSAADFDCRGVNVFYFYNPFGAALLAEVIDNIRRALPAATAPVRILYANPVCREVLDAADWLTPPTTVHTGRDGKPWALLYRAR